MTALLELKQKIKGIYGQYEMYILPVLKFVLALVYFLWVNSNMGYMSQLNNVFVILILALICSILPSSAMMYIGFILILAHSYALGIEVAGFMLVIILLMLIFFMRFSGEQNITFVFIPAFLCIQYSGTASDWKRTDGEQPVCNSGRMRCGNVLFYPLLKSTVRDSVESGS